MEEVYHCPAITSIGGCFGLFGGLGEVPITSGVYPVTRSSDYQNWSVGFFLYLWFILLLYYHSTRADHESFLYSHTVASFFATVSLDIFTRGEDN